MRTYACTCGNTLFFDSTECVSCSSMVGICSVCRQVGPMRPDEDNTVQCSNLECQTSLVRCRNDQDYGICNCYVVAGEGKQSLCIYCRLNSLVPDLSIAANVVQWSKLEAAKRRVLYGVQDLGLQIDSRDSSSCVPLTFAFKSEVVEPVSTGHSNGCITINLREADEVEREKTRVAFGEPQRTLVGHFRHELGHYYWEVLVRPVRVEPFRDIFGDERKPEYQVALQNYYEHGPAGNWRMSFISAYASMHPWEDFAESFAAYLDMTAVLVTAGHFDLAVNESVEFDRMTSEYHKVGIAANELSRDMGLIDLVPEVWTSPVIQKLKFIHELCTSRVDQ